MVDNLVGLDKQELQELLISLGEKPFRAKQIWHLIYNQGKTDINDFTTLSKDLREKLSKHFEVKRPKIVSELTSTDKTRKWLLEFDDNKKIETVYIPEKDRGAVCISTQVGCAVGCKFCNTGSQKLERNLSAAEIVSQFMTARDSYGEWPSPIDETRYLSNIVVMGMGEPLHNLDETIKALKILTDGDGIAISKRRVTLSTSGITPQITKIAQEIGCKLALSLHAPNNEIRSKIMPINKKYPLEEVLDACKEYQEITGGRQYITFEYLMLDGINDKPEHAKEIAKKIKQRKIGAKFNLIAFNPWAGCDYKSSPKSVIHKFSQTLEDEGFSAPIRVSRGQDIMAACGQLKSKNSTSE